MSVDLSKFEMIRYNVTFGEMLFVFKKCLENP